MPAPTKPLFILEMANNHMGSVATGLQIIEQMAKATERYMWFDVGVKLQYRDAAVLRDPKFLAAHEGNRFVKRFSETALTWGEYKTLKDAIDEAGFVSVATPFDMASVAKITEHEYDYIKLPSCYATDDDLLDAVSRIGAMPTIVSLAGSDEIDIDTILLCIAPKLLTLMHCVAEYPTPKDHSYLGRIRWLRNHYPDVHAIGYSTHESPDDLQNVSVALAMGATVFEKHVCAMGTPPNQYSANAEQVDRWLGAATMAAVSIGVDYKPSETELTTLDELQDVLQFTREFQC